MNLCDAIDRPNPRLWDAQSDAKKSNAFQPPAVCLYSLTFMQRLIFEINATYSNPAEILNAF